MAAKRKQPDADRPTEVNMTDLEAAEPRRRPNDIHAAGTPGGGVAAGGLAGTNIGDGDPDNADLENAMGDGTRDTDGDEE